MYRVWINAPYLGVCMTLKPPQLLQKQNKKKERNHGHNLWLR